MAIELALKSGLLNPKTDVWLERIQTRYLDTGQRLGEITGGDVLLSLIEKASFLRNRRVVCLVASLSAVVDTEELLTFYLKNGFSLSEIEGIIFAYLDIQ